jgi:hypothetical protein
MAAAPVFDAVCSFLGDYQSGRGNSGDGRYGMLGRSSSRDCCFSVRFVALLAVGLSAVLLTPFACAANEAWINSTSGDLSGLGTLGPVALTGAPDAGFAPNITMVGSIIFGASNTLIMEVGGTVRGDEHDAIVASGHLGFGGTLQVTLINAFTPAISDSFDLFDWASFSGSFSTFNLPALGAGLMWDTTQLYTDGALSIALAGDFNFDGAVDAADYVAWRKGMSPNPNSQSDFNLWYAQFGETIGPGSGGSTFPHPDSDAIDAELGNVPEPSNLATIVVCVILLIGRCRRR